MIICGGLLIGIGLWAVWPASREPKYHGKLLSEWLSLYQKRSSGELSIGEIDAAPEALRQIGTNALPFLLKWIQPRQTPTGLERLLQRLPDSLQERFPINRLVGREAMRAQEAAAGFGVLGPLARPAIPDLERLATSGASYAQFALYQLGADGLSALLDGLAEAGRPNRANLVRLIGQRSVWPNPGRALPVLITCLEDGDPQVAAESARALGRLGVAEGLALPALITTLDHTNRLVRDSAARAIADFGPLARPALPALIRGLKDPRLARVCAEVLGDLALEPRLVVPELTRALQNNEPSVRLAAAHALGKLGEEARSAVPFLVDAYGDADSYMRQAAENAIAQICPIPFPETEMFRRRYGLPASPK